MDPAVSDDQSLNNLMAQQNQEMNSLESQEGLPSSTGGGVSGGSKKTWLVVGIVAVVVVVAVVVYLSSKSSTASASSSSVYAATGVGTSASSTSAPPSTSVAGGTTSVPGSATSTAPPAPTGPGSTVAQGSMPSTGNGATTTASKVPAAAQSAVKKYTPTGVAVINNTASHAAQVSLLSSGAPVAIPGHSAALNTFDKNMAKAHAISGVTPHNVVILNPAGASPHNAVRVLDSAQPTAIPGHTAAINTYDKNQARRGVITGVTKTGVVTTHATPNNFNNVRGLLNSNQAVSLGANVSPAQAGRLQFLAKHGKLTRAIYNQIIG